MKQKPFVAPLEAERRKAEIQRLQSALAEATAKKKQSQKRVFNTPASDEE